MGDSSLNFKAFFYVDSFQNRYAALDEANTKIYNVLNKKKISIPFPQMDVHIKQESKKNDNPRKNSKKKKR
jgi:small-conductance mechanosensitive channel